jgi:hypothetical protein
MKREDFISTMWLLLIVVVFFGLLIWWNVS